MKYHQPTKQMTIEMDRIECASLSFLNAIKNIRKASNLPLTKYARDGALEPSDFSQKAIIDGAYELGIDFGVRWGNELDVSDVG